ncbi:MAG TPA: lysozyme inhibitor LprI family protein [Flavobacterium sp.]|nr:lysozyme inhibitor LprI family protein [Flavobacterium sp.]
MKQCIILFCGILIHFGCTDKKTKDEQILLRTETARIYSDSTNNRHVKEVEKESLLFIQKLNTEYLTKEEVKFAKDTFAIHLKNQKRQEYDSSTEGMNNAVLEMASAYEKLLNQYYNQLRNVLDTADKTALETAQKNWQEYCDSEKAFIQIMADPRYNSGGTMQSNITVGNYFELVKTRTNQLFSHYNSTIEKKESEE